MDPCGASEPPVFAPATSSSLPATPGSSLFPGRVSSTPSPSSNVTLLASSLSLLPSTPSTTQMFCGDEYVPLSPQCEAILSALAAARPTSAISVWQPRPDVTQRGSSRVKKFNQAFLDLCDAVTVKPNEPKSAIVPLHPHFLSEQTARVVGASMERNLRMITALHRGLLARAADVIIHVSRLGRQKTTLYEVLPVTDAVGMMTEYIVIHTLVDPEIYRPGESVDLPLVCDCICRV